MASTTCPQTFSLLHAAQRSPSHQTQPRKRCSPTPVRVSTSDGSAGSSQPPKPPPRVDTRIHWDDPDEGWIGGSTSSQSSNRSTAEEEPNYLLGDKFADLLDSADSHYQFLGVEAGADLEEIKVAYRRLSKEYHPDTTSLPLKVASDKFMKLREIYDVLSDDKKRRFYDWTLAQEAASRQAERLRMKLEDPYQVELDNFVSVPDTFDRLGGKNMPLSDQALSALSFEVFTILFSLGCIIYVVFFKEPN